MTDSTPAPPGSYRRLMQNSLATVIANFINIGLAFFLSPYLIHRIGQEGYGVWMLVASFSAASGYMALLDPGIQGATVKFIAQHRAADAEDSFCKTIWVSFLSYALLGILSSIFLIFFGTFFSVKVFNIPTAFHHATRALFILLAVQSFFEFFKQAWVAIYSGLEKYDILRLIQVSFSILQVGFIVGFLFMGYGVLSLGIANLLGTCLSCGVLILRGLPFLPRALWRVPRDWKREDVMPLFRLGGSLLGFRITGIVFRQLDKLLIPVMLNSTLLTPYSIANHFYQVSESARNYISSNLVPVASGLATLNKKDRLKDTFLRGTKFTLAFTMPVVMTGIWLAQPMVVYWVGQSLIQAASLAQILLGASLVVATHVIGFNMLIGMNKIRNLLYINLSSSILNVAFSVALTRFAGLTGTVTALLLTQIVIWYPYTRLYLKELQISWLEYFRQGLMKPLALGAFLFFVLGGAERIFSPQNLLQTIVLGGGTILLYWGAFFLLGMEEPERTNVWRWVKSFSIKARSIE